VLAFLLWIAAARAPWPSSRSQWLHLAVTGVFMHAGYLGGVWVAVKGGLGAGMTALIVGLQPVLTAVWLSSIGRSQRVALAQWLGLVLGFLGLVLVVWDRLGAGEVRATNLAWGALALASITIGTLYQKRYLQACDVRTANTVQLAAAFVVTLPFALLERGSIDWHPELIGAMAWSVLVLTLGGSSLLYMLLQRGAAMSVTSLMYLVPPTTAVMAWILFREALTPLILTGLALTAVGVWLVVRERRT
jgi:drug/metabolite transporter (DMT)-like permease